MRQYISSILGTPSFDWKRADPNGMFIAFWVCTGQKTGQKTKWYRFVLWGTSPAMTSALPCNIQCWKESIWIRKHGLILHWLLMAHPNIHLPFAKWLGFMWLKMLLLLARYGRWWACTKSPFATSIAQSNNRDVAEIKHPALSQQVLTYFSITVHPEEENFKMALRQYENSKPGMEPALQLAFLFCDCISVQKSTLNHRLLLEWDKRKPGTLTLIRQLPSREIVLYKFSGTGNRYCPSFTSSHNFFSSCMNMQTYAKNGWLCFKVRSFLSSALGVKNRWINFCGNKLPRTCEYGEDCPLKGTFKQFHLILLFGLVL